MLTALKTHTFLPFPLLHFRERALQAPARFSLERGFLTRICQDDLCRLTTPSFFLPCPKPRPVVHMSRRKKQNFHHHPVFSHVAGKTTTLLARATLTGCAHNNTTNTHTRKDKKLRPRKHPPCYPCPSPRKPRGATRVNRGSWKQQRVRSTSMHQYPPKISVVKLCFDPGRVGPLHVK